MQNCMNILKGNTSSYTSFLAQTNNLVINNHFTIQLLCFDNLIIFQRQTVDLEGIRTLSTLPKRNSPGTIKTGKKILERKLTYKTFT